MEQPPKRDAARGGARRCAWRGALGGVLCAAAASAETWHYAQMDFELYRLEAMGVKPTADGWAAYEMDPIPGAEGMRATVPTPRGDLSFSARTPSAP